MRDQVLLRPSEVEETAAGGIVLPGAEWKKPTGATVLAAGSGRVLDNGKHVPASVEAGQTVIYSRYAGAKVAVEDEHLIFVDEGSILAVRG
jgi:chaperonin GroES